MWGKKLCRLFCAMQHFLRRRDCEIGVYPVSTAVQQFSAQQPFAGVLHIGGRDSQHPRDLHRCDRRVVGGNADVLPQQVIRHKRPRLLVQSRDTAAGCIESLRCIALFRVRFHILQSFPQLFAPFG